MLRSWDLETFLRSLRYDALCWPPWPESPQLFATQQFRGERHRKECHCQKSYGIQYSPYLGSDVRPWVRYQTEAGIKGYLIPSRMEPTMPPTTPPSTVRVVFSWGKYWSMAWASLAMGSVCSHIRPGPVSAARKMPSPPKIKFLMPGTVVI